MIEVSRGKTVRDNVPASKCAAPRQRLRLLLSFCGSSAKNENLILIPHIP